MGIITKGMGAIMKAKMKKAGVKKPTFPGPRASELLDKEFRKRTKYQKPSSDLVESSARVRKNQKIAILRSMFLMKILKIKTNSIFILTMKSW